MASHAHAWRVSEGEAIEAVRGFLAWAAEIGAMDIGAASPAASGAPRPAATTAPSAGVDVPHAGRPRYWRREPQLLRGHFSEAVVGPFDVERFFSWAHAPANGAPLHADGGRQARVGRAGLLPDPALARGLYELYREQDEPLTILLNRAERVGRELRCLREALPPGPAWREGDIVATLSSAGSGIGFHAGPEDGYVVQLRGSRRWRVWDSGCLPDAYVRALLGEGEDERVHVPTRPDLPPVVDCRLDPGDALYIPALMPHEGITLEESISLAIAWKGLSPYYLLTAVVDFTATRVQRIVTTRPETFFRLIPDAPDDVSVSSFLYTEITPALEALGEAAPDRRGVLQYLGRLSGELQTTLSREDGAVDRAE